MLKGGDASQSYIYTRKTDVNCSLADNLSSASRQQDNKTPYCRTTPVHQKASGNLMAMGYGMLAIYG